MNNTTKTNAVTARAYGHTIEIRDEAGNLAVVNPRGNPDLGIPSRSDRAFADRIFLACNSHDDLVAAVERLLNAFIHIPGDAKGNKARTAIFTHCVNMREAATKAREVLGRSKAQPKPIAGAAVA